MEPQYVMLAIFWVGTLAIAYAIGRDTEWYLHRKKCLCKKCADYRKYTRERAVAEPSGNTGELPDA